MSEKKLEPLIKTTTLRDKEVAVKDTMNFDRLPSPAPEQPSSRPQRPPKKQKTEAQRRQEIMKTQKMSLDILLKLDILDPFLRSAENIQHDNKISINDKIEILINSYLNAKLSTRQLEGFKAIYDTYTNAE